MLIWCSLRPNLSRRRNEMVSEHLHKFFCSYACCRFFIFGTTVERLAENLNIHNRGLHADDPESDDPWTAETIVCSKNYYSPVDSRPTAPPDDARIPAGPLPQYLVPYGVTSKWEWGSALKAPDITPADIAMLAKGHVRW